MTHRVPPIAFAHRGGMAHFPANTLRAFKNSIGRGATGLETDAWTSADGHVVLAHDGEISSFWGLKKSKISAIELAQLPKSIPTLEALYSLMRESSRPDIELFIDVKGDDTAAAIIAIARAANDDATKHLWLAHAGFKDSDWHTVSSWRTLDADVHLVDSTRPKRFGCSAAEYGAQIKAAGIDAINLPASDWNAGLVETFRDSGLICLGFRAHTKRKMRKLTALGLDGIHSNNVVKLLAAIAETKS